MACNAPARRYPFKEGTEGTEGAGGAEGAGAGKEEGGEDDEDDTEGAGGKAACRDGKARPTRPTNPRFYTPRECARIMGFPDTFVVDDTTKQKDFRVVHQLGNAVVPTIVGKIIRCIVDTGVYSPAT